MNDYKTLYRSVAHNLPISAPQEISENTGYYYEYMYNPYVDDDVLAKKVFGVGNKDNKRDYSKEYLTYEILEGSGTLFWWANDGIENGGQSMFCSLNGGEWIGCTSHVYEEGGEQYTYWYIELQVKAGDIIRFKNNGSYDEYGNTNYGYPSIEHEENDCTFNAYGNTMSVIYGDAFNNKFTFPSSDVSWFESFFADSDVVDASNLILPATTLANGCYNNMFNGCTSLTTAPVLPATTLASNCYSNMFNGCTSLTKAPELPAQTLVPRCYLSMFKNCTNLNYIECLATDVSAEDCTKNWVSNVSETGTFVGDLNSSWRSGPNGVPIRWTTNVIEVPF